MLSFGLCTILLATLNMGGVPTNSNVIGTQHDCFYQISTKPAFPIFHLKMPVKGKFNAFESFKFNYWCDGLLRCKLDKDVYWIINRDLDSAHSIGLYRVPCDELDLPYTKESAAKLIARYKLKSTDDEFLRSSFGGLHRFYLNDVLKDEYMRNGSYSFGAQGLRGSTKGYYYDLLPERRESNGKFGCQLHIKTPDKKILVYCAGCKVACNGISGEPEVVSNWTNLPREVIQKADFDGDFFLFESPRTRVYVTSKGDLLHAGSFEGFAPVSLKLLEASKTYKIFHVITVENEPYYFGRDRQNPNKYCCFNFHNERIGEHKIEYAAPENSKLPLPLRNSQLCLKLLVELKLWSK